MCFQIIMLCISQGILALLSENDNEAQERPYKKDA